ncbi:zinc transporter ZntB [Sphingomonas solaris]|uniref:Zinc transporter ZntB n=1 Tax=Alterirhizorhabdus solaris TaxID=2529389 RepID=A0A558RD04_9SPHN|nr:zinc transporter ZntB [Sphingomonas solaris]TVV77355.1 zinc transporter ZntB [Sphingomonas solaris]
MVKSDSATLFGDSTLDGPSIFARVLDGHGGLQSIDWNSAKSWRPDTADQTLWLHLDRGHPDVVDWLATGLGVPEATVEVLTSDENRPRAFSEDGALVTVLRGINFNPDAAPEDMVAMQIWADAQRVVTLRRQHLQTPSDVLATIERGRGPRTAGDLVTELVEQTVAKMNRSIVDMNDKIDELEAADEQKTASPDETLDVIADIRRNCLALKRYMSPQHEALIQIGRDAPTWMNEANRRDIRETIDRLRRYIEDLTVSQESAIVLQDEINSREAAKANRTIYMLSIVAAIFLPLTFVTGLLGINVGGIPGADSARGFSVTVGALAAVLVVQIIVFRKLKWL